MIMSLFWFGFVLSNYYASFFVGFPFLHSYWLGAHIFAGSCRHDIAQTDPYQPTGMPTWYFGVVHLHPILHLIYIHLS